MALLLTILILGVIILIHEWGHFIAARIFKVPVSEFSIGMGPELYSYYTGETSYSIKMIPVGGYVNIDGMEYDSKLVNGFNSQKSWKRFIILFAGVFMNFLLAYVLIMGIVFSSGKTVQIKGFVKDTAVSKILLVGDKIKKIDGKEIFGKKEFVEKIHNYPKNKTSLNMEIEREGKNIEVELPLMKDGRLGVYFDNSEPIGIYEGIKEGNKAFVQSFIDIFSGIGKLIKGDFKKEEISGPVGMIKIVGNVKMIGIKALILLTAMLSINIGIFNLLPFPALDGGRIIFVILEMCGIKISKKFEEKMHMVGLAIIFGLILIITGNDIINLFR